jgi:hypothetical protein
MTVLPHTRRASALRSSLVVLVLALAGCGGGSEGSGPADRPDPAADQAQREFDICLEQADQIAATQGAEAGSAHLEECTRNLANETPAAP